MSPRIAYILKQALRLHTDTWFTDSQLQALEAYLESQGVKITEGEEG